MLYGLLLPSVKWVGGPAAGVFRPVFPMAARAVGKLQVPGQRYRNGHSSHYLEDCSATLVSNATQHNANTIITAWHCLELYNDLSKPILFTARATSGEPLEREAFRLADGGGNARRLGHFAPAVAPYAQNRLSL